MYIDGTKDDCATEHIKKAITTPDDLGEARRYLMYLMSSESCQDRDSRVLLPSGNKRLLQEIETFLRTSTTGEDS